MNNFSLGYDICVVLFHMVEEAEIESVGLQRLEFILDYYANKSVGKSAAHAINDHSILDKKCAHILNKFSSIELIMNFLT